MLNVIQYDPATVQTGIIDPCRKLAHDVTKKLTKIRSPTIASMFKAYVSIFGEIPIGFSLHIGFGLYLKTTYTALMKTTSRTSRTQRRERSRGSVIVEMAICMPFMVMLVFGCLELNSSIFLNQTLTSAAHEGALVGLKQNATQADVENRIATIMGVRKISPYQVQIRTAGVPFDELVSGDSFSIDIEAPRSNSFVSLSRLKSSVTALRP